jgi:hypothetical protein
MGHLTVPAIALSTGLLPVRFALAAHNSLEHAD